MSAHELTLKLRFVSTDAMVAFLSKPPTGVQIMGNNGEVTSGRTRKGTKGHTAARWVKADDDKLLDYWAAVHNDSSDSLSPAEAAAIADELGRTANGVQARLRVLLARG